MSETRPLITEILLSVCILLMVVLIIDRFELRRLERVTSEVVAVRGQVAIITIKAGVRAGIYSEDDKREISRHWTQGLYGNEPNPFPEYAEK